MYELNTEQDSNFMILFMALNVHILKWQKILSYINKNQLWDFHIYFYNKKNQTKQFICFALSHLRTKIPWHGRACRVLRWRSREIQYDWAMYAEDINGRGQLSHDADELLEAVHELLILKIAWRQASVSF